MGGILEGHDIVSNLDVRHTLANGFNDTGALMTKDYGESTLRVLS